MLRPKLGETMLFVVPPDPELHSEGFAQEAVVTDLGEQHVTVAWIADGRRTGNFHLKDGRAVRGDGFLVKAPAMSSNQAYALQ